MNCALNEKNELIYTSDIELSQPQESNWFCPKCLGKVILKTSKNGKLFFAHLSCKQIHSQLLQSESDQHKLGKQILKHLLSVPGYEVELERYHPEINQTSDVYVINEQTRDVKIFEFQNSPIAAKHLKQRHQNYLTLYNQVTWLTNYRIIDLNKLNKKWHQVMMHYHPILGYYLPTICLDRREIICLGQLPLIYTPGKVLINEYQMSLISNTVKKVGVKKRTKVQACSYDKILHRMLKNRHYQTEIMALYEAGLLIQDLPRWILIDQAQLLLGVKPGWVYFAWIYYYLRFFPDRSHEDIVQKILENPQLTWAKCPMIEISFIRESINEIIQLLQKRSKNNDNPFNMC